MTDRIKGITVTLDGDYRDDDVEAIVQAIRMVKGVAHVALHVTTLEDHMARARVRADLGKEILGLYQRILGGS